MDPSIAPFNASVHVDLSSTGTYKLQFSLSAPDVADASAIWFDSVNIPDGTTATATTNLMFPVGRVRAVIAANGGTITLQICQGYTNN
jgi:hypothetical protein